MFEDTSTNSPDYWQWSFGDGALSSAENPTHTYIQSGTYTVTLTTENAGGSNTTTMTGYITVSPQYATTSATPVLLTTSPTLATVTQQATAIQSTTETTAAPASAGTSPSWTLPLIVVVILVLVVIALVLRRGGQSGGRRRYRGGDL